jgi:hypothetical protein
VQVGPLIDVWVYHIGEGVDVVIVTYGCYAESSQNLVHSSEHKAAWLFGLDELDQLNMPGGYKRSIKSWAERLVSPSPPAPLLPGEGREASSMV